MNQVAALRRYLVDAQITCVAMEATSTYWKPFYYGLENAGFDVILVNPRHVHQMRGRKTDVADAAWLARLAALGMLAGSFVPPEQIRALRLVTRRHVKLTQQRTAEIARLEKLLEDMRLKLSSVSSSLLTKTGRKILDAICQGQTDPKVLARGSRLHTPMSELIEALACAPQPYHLTLIKGHLRLIDQLDAEIAALSEQTTILIEPVRSARDLLTTIPGVSEELANQMIAEIGADMSMFPTPGHLASWAGVAPGSNESAGISKSAKCRRGNNHLKRALGLATNTAVKGNNFLATRYRRIVSRQGKPTAQVAIMHSMTTAIWHMLTNSQPFTDLGADFSDRRDTKRTIARLEARLEALKTMPA
jgi:transposase